MKELDEILSKATAAVGELYFQFPIDGGSPIYRERVYCYELYHQMRTLWPEECDFTLNGEVDKQSHPILRKLGITHAIPDFLVHTPGSMKGNHAIIEVKSENAARGGITEDLAKLARFTVDVGYARAIYLFYGEPDLRLVRSIAASMDHLPPIELWVHANYGDAAKRIEVLQGKPKAPIARAQG